MTELGPEQRTDPMARIFPKVCIIIVINLWIFFLQVTKCTFHKFGPSGTVMKFDGICVLPLNIINEKIYVFLWFWFVFLAIVTKIQLVYRLLVIMLPGLRATLLKV